MCKMTAKPQFFMHVTSILQGFFGIIANWQVHDTVLSTSLEQVVHRSNMTKFVSPGIYIIDEANTLQAHHAWSFKERTAQLVDEGTAQCHMRTEIEILEILSEYHISVLSLAGKRIVYMSFLFNFCNKIKAKWSCGMFARLYLTFSKDKLQ